MNRDLTLCLVDSAALHYPTRTVDLICGSGGNRKGGALDFLVRLAHGLAVCLAIAQRGVANARELVGQSAGGLVVVGAPLHGEGSLTQGIDASSGLGSAARGVRHRTRATTVLVRVIADG